MIVRRPAHLRPTAGRPAPTRHKRPELAHRYVPPDTPTERKLCELWGDLLRIEPVGIHDGFFDLGGDSLLAIQLVSRLRQSFVKPLTLRQIFELRTVAKLAKAFDVADDSELERLVDGVEGLTPEEAISRLEAEGTPRANDE